MITGTTRLYAIIGDPIEHVRTPMAFNDYFAARNIDAVCLPIHIARDDLPRGWAGLRSVRNLDGFIVTAPHKQESAQLCDALEGDGAYTKVVNTVRREKDGSFTGTLLDGRGFVSGLTTHGHQVAGRRFYIAGAGGAGTALAYALAGSGAAAITIHNRTRSKAERLVAGVAKAFPACQVTLGNADASGHDIVVNATSLGLPGSGPVILDFSSLAPGPFVCDVIPNPPDTPFLQQARTAGATTIDGRGMLLNQAAINIELWTGVDPDRAVMGAALDVAIAGWEHP
jgi:shikimate dehydrogenase